MIVRVATADHYSWICERARLVVTPGFQALEAVARDGRILGMVAYDGYRPNSVNMHMALDWRSAARHLLRPAFHGAFVELGRGIVYGQVLSSNPRSLALCLHLGFREVARLKDAWEPGVDIHLVEMRRDECRWLDMPNTPAIRRVA